MGLKTFKYRLYPTSAQEKCMFNTLAVCRNFYNMCLEERKLTYELEGRSVKKSDQEKIAIRYRQTFPQARTVFSQTLQTVADDLDQAFKAFFRRVKAGDTIWSLCENEFELPLWLIKKYNDSVNFAQLKPGVRLVVPRVESIR